ncbi:MAG: hypothetical protein KC619_33590 [Myxococcales bacterium]|nr:hypothetical protein [Myxococcales bacterium]
MGSDVTFFGQIDFDGEGARDAWLAAKVTKAAVRGLPAPFRRLAEPFPIWTLIEALGTDGVVRSTKKVVRLAGELEEGQFFETWAAELAGALSVAAKQGQRGTLHVLGEDLRVRLAIDDGRVVAETPTDAQLARARRSAAHRLLDALDKDLAAEVEAAGDRFLHGTKSRAAPAGGFDDVVAALEELPEAKVLGGLGKADDVPSKRGLVRPKKLFGTRAALVAAARESDVVEHRALAIEVLSHADVKHAAPACLAIAKDRKAPPAYRAAALGALGREGGEEGLAQLVAELFGKLTTRDRNDPVLATLAALASAKHPDAARRVLEAMPRKKGKTADTLMARAGYVVLSLRAKAARPLLVALAEDEGFAARYLATVAVQCLDAGHTGNFYHLAIR